MAKSTITAEPVASTAEQPANTSTIHTKTIDWFLRNKRELPWRQPMVQQQANPAWAILVSEIMLQQTPVNRILAPWEAWLKRWPTPKDLAITTTADIIRAWGRLGYPRRALRLKETAVIIAENHNNTVPATYTELIELPGIGDYTAAAVSTFAYGNRETVLDINIRRVEARAFSAKALPNRSCTATEKNLAHESLPATTHQAVQWNNAVMELGALVCTSKEPACDQCPIRMQCAWVNAGKPEPEYVRAGQKWHGTDRQVRGAIMAILRNSATAVDVALLPGKHHVGTNGEQIERAVKSLQADGLATSSREGFLSLPDV